MNLINGTVRSYQSNSGNPSSLPEPQVPGFVGMWNTFHNTSLQEGTMLINKDNTIHFATTFMIGAPTPGRQLALAGVGIWTNNGNNVYSARITSVVNDFATGITTFRIKADFVFTVSSNNNNFTGTVTSTVYAPSDMAFATPLGTNSETNVGVRVIQ